MCANVCFMSFFTAQVCVHSDLKWSYPHQLLGLLTNCDSAVMQFKVWINRGGNVSKPVRSHLKGWLFSDMGDFKGAWDAAPPPYSEVGQVLYYFRTVLWQVLHFYRCSTSPDNVLLCTYTVLLQVLYFNRSCISTDTVLLKILYFYRYCSFTGTVLVQVLFLYMYFYL